MLKAAKKVTTAMRRHVTKSKLPILQNVMIRDGYAYLTTLDHWVSIRATDSSGIDLSDALVPLAEFTSWVEHGFAPGEKPVESHQDFPLPPLFPDHCEVIDDVPVHKIQAMLPYISKDRHRTALNCLCIDAAERCDVRLVATDSWRMLETPINPVNPFGGEPGAWLIPRDLVEIVAKIYSGGVVTLFLTPERVWIEGTVDGVRAVVSGTIPGDSVVFPNWRQFYDAVDREQYTVSYDEFEQLRKRAKIADAPKVEIALNGRMGFFIRDTERQLVGLTAASDDMKYCDTSIAVNTEYLRDIESLAVASGVKKRDLKMTEFTFGVEGPHKPLAITHSASVARARLMPMKMK